MAAIQVGHLDALEARVRPVEFPGLPVHCQGHWSAQVIHDQGPLVAGLNPGEERMGRGGWRRKGGE